MSKFPQFLPRHEIGVYPFAGLTTELARRAGAFEAQRAVPYDIDGSLHYSRRDHDADPHGKLSQVPAKLDAYVAVDASGTFSETKRQVGLLRMLQAGVIVSDTRA
jgi:hypothetical protein